MTPPRWIAAFEPKTSLWWGRFLPEGFGHVFAFGFVPPTADTPGTWLYMEATLGGTRIGVAQPDQIAGWFWLARMGRMRLLRMATLEVPDVPRPRITTCAGAVASLFGLRRYPLTPQGLFWTLRRLGAEELVQP